MATRLDDPGAASEGNNQNASFSDVDSARQVRNLLRAHSGAGNTEALPQMYAGLSKTALSWRSSYHSRSWSGSGST